MTIAKCLNMFHDLALHQESQIILSVRQALLLIWSILGLKFLHMLAAIFPAKSHVQRTPSNRIHDAIAQKENQIIDIFLCIVPSHDLPSARANPTSMPLLCVQSVASLGIECPQPGASNPHHLTIEEVNKPPRKPPTALMRPPAIRISRSRLDFDGTFTLEDEEGEYPTTNPRCAVISESVYSMPGRNTSASQIQSRSSAPLVPAAQYAKLLPDRPYFTSSPPFSLDSMTLPLSNDVGLDMERSQSAESFPGKFPVSDGLEYSSLSTPQCFRGRGATSVRPFSDV